MMQRFGTYDELYDLFRDFDHLFRRTMWQARELPGETSRMPRALPSAPTGNAFCPAVECFTQDRQLVLRVELPGVDPKDVDVSIAGRQVFLSGVKKEERRTDESDFLFQEVCRGRFERSFTLPETVKADQVKASFHNGVLELTMPWVPLDQARKVPIEIGEGGRKVKAA